MSLAQPIAAPQRRQRPQHDHAPERPGLHVVPARVPSSGKVVFLVICMIILVGGLLGSLTLNTLMAEGSYRQAQLQREIAQEAQTRDRLQTQLNDLNTPAQLARAAKRLGMVQQPAPLMIRLADDTIIGLDD